MYINAHDMKKSLQSVVVQINEHSLHSPDWNCFGIKSKVNSTKSLFFPINSKVATSLSGKSNTNATTVYRGHRSPDFERSVGSRFTRTKTGTFVRCFSKFWISRKDRAPPPSSRRKIKHLTLPNVAAGRSVIQSTAPTFEPPGKWWYIKRLIRVMWTDTHRWQVVDNFDFIHSNNGVYQNEIIIEFDNNKTCNGTIVLISKLQSIWLTRWVVWLKSSRTENVNSWSSSATRNISQSYY